MAGAGYRSLMVAACALLALVSAQVTFSRDWSGGKRSPAAAFDCEQFTRLCRQFIRTLHVDHGLKLSKHRRPASPQSPPDADDTTAYDDK